MRRTIKSQKVNCKWFHSRVGILLLFLPTLLFQVKPLGVIWGKFSEFYNKKNTIMFDDIGRNFLMNPQNGLKVILSVIGSSQKYRHHSDNE